MKKYILISMIIGAMGANASMGERMEDMGNMQNMKHDMSNMQNKGNMNKMGKTMPLEMVNKMPEGMQLKLKYDYMVNLPILMRAVLKNIDNEKLALTKEQQMALKKHKTEVMDTINPVMKSSHELSAKLKHGLLDGSLSQEEATKLSKKISEMKEQALNMKIVCITFIRQTLSSEQFKTLLEIDKSMPYLNSPYNY